jgi:hypothetical protein
MADTLVLEASAVRCAGSSPVPGTKLSIEFIGLRYSSPALCGVRAHASAPGSSRLATESDSEFGQLCSENSK